MRRASAMKRWSEAASICERIAALWARGEGAALATLVSLEGSGYRRPGARLLVERSGAGTGGLSGGCLEADVIGRARRVMATGRAIAVRYETGGEEIPPWGLRTGCSGVLEVWIEPLPPGGASFPLAAVRAALAGDHAFSLASRLVDGAVETRLGEARRPIDLGWRAERFHPPPRLAVIGVGADALPLLELAAGVGFRVTAIDHRADVIAALRRRSDIDAAQARPGDGPPPAADLVVVKTHDLELDQTWIASFLAAAARPAYVGVMGSRARVEEVCGGLSFEAREGVRGPVGLDIGAEGPEQLAVSIVAELLASCSSRMGGSLAERQSAIHVA